MEAFMGGGPSVFRLRDGWEGGGGTSLAFLFFCFYTARLITEMRVSACEHGPRVYKQAREGLALAAYVRCASPLALVLASCLIYPCWFSGEISRCPIGRIDARFRCRKNTAVQN